MAARPKIPFSRPSTRRSRDGETIFVTLRISRQFYELARYWAMFHGEAMPEGTAEDQLEGYLNSAMMGALSEAPKDFKKNRPDPATRQEIQDDLDDDIPY